MEPDQSSYSNSCPITQSTSAMFNDDFQGTSSLNTSSDNMPQCNATMLHLHLHNNQKYLKETTEGRRND